MVDLVLVELRRCLARRLVRRLLAVGALVTAVTGLIARRQAASATEDFLPVLHTPGEPGLLVHLVPLCAIGAIVGAASTVGAEWRANTIATLLTWEPRRVRIAFAKVVACAAVAFVGALLFQLLLLAALVPALDVMGELPGLDAAWLGGYLGDAERVAALTALAAAATASIAMVARNTAGAIVVVFVWLGLVEPVVLTALAPLARFLVLPNAMVVLGLADWSGDGAPPAGPCFLLLVAYTVALWFVATLTFSRRDVTSSA